MSPLKFIHRNFQERTIRRYCYSHKEIIPIFNEKHIGNPNSAKHNAGSLLLLLTILYIQLLLFNIVIMLLILFHFYYICFVNVELIFIQNKFNQTPFGHWQNFIQNSKQN